MRELETSLAHMRGAWMAGRPAAEHCPLEWRGAIEGADAECALAALAGHATAVLFRPVAPAPMEPRALLPKLDLPTLPEPLRPLARRCMARRKEERQFESHLINLLTARGYTMHPADWMPSPSDEWTPDVYAPWLDWLRREDKPFPPPAFALETYEQWSVAMRRGALAALRTHDSGAARAIIAAKASSEPAEQRVMLIGLLEAGLSDTDAEYLETLASDRSERVQAVARHYLARLGRRTEADANVRELAEMMELRRDTEPPHRVQLAIKHLKNSAQDARRIELFKVVSLASLASALGLTEEEITEAAVNGPLAETTAFIRMFVATSSDRACRSRFDQLLSDGGPALHTYLVGKRLTIEERRALQPRIVEGDAEMFLTTLAHMGRALGETSLAALLKSPSYATLMAAIEALRGENDKQRREAGARLELMLNCLALLAAAPAAKTLLERLIASGLSAADPRLDLLRLNAALTTEVVP